MRAALLAWSFLSRVPIPTLEGVNEHDMARATRWYPTVGLGVGLFQLGALTVGSWAVNPLFGAVLCVAAGEWFTRGFHLDGLSDCFDGMLVNGDAERRLAVMKDPHVGGLGAAAICLWMLLRVAAVLAMVESGGVMWGLLCGPVIARALLAADITAFAPASPNGLYASLHGRVTRWDAGVAGLLGGIAVLGLAQWGVVTAGVVGLGALALPLWWHRGWVKRLGGINGDVLGASVQLRELWVWLCLG